MADILKSELQGAFGVSSIAKWHDRFSSVLNDPDELRLDMSDVTSIDASAIQLILAGQKKANDVKTGLHLDHVADNVKTSLEAAGALDALSGSIATPA